jgi:DNA methyltransferase 1-associated protein 1
MKLGGMNRDMLSLVAGKHTDPATAMLPPIVPTFTKNIQVKVGNKTISSSKPCRKWEWSPFTTSARADGQQFRHWVRAGVEYTDYPYARFDIHLEPVEYTDEEYRKYLQHKTWTKSDTDKLMEMARVYELRWAVIYDRWCAHESSSRNCQSSDGHQPQKARKIEDLQHRFYSVAAILAQTRIAKEAAAEVSALSLVPNLDNSEHHLIETAAARAIATTDPQHQPLMASPGTGTSNKPVFDLEKERERRAYLELVWSRSKAEEEEELELRKELALIEAQLRKLKKSGGHILASGQSASSKSASRPVSPVVPSSVDLDKAFASTAPTPMPETPYLQSGRLAPPATGGPLGINKLTLKRMETVMEELKVNFKPVPTKRNCDLYDSLRKDILTLLALQKSVLQKEGQLQTKRLRLAKISSASGRPAVDEEALMGITPAPPPPPAPAARAKPKAKPRTNNTHNSAGGKTAASKSAPKTVSKTTATMGGESASDAAKGKKAPSKKRKKADSNKTGAQGGDATTAATAAPSASKADSGDDHGKAPVKKRARKA